MNKKKSIKAAVVVAGASLAGMVPTTANAQKIHEDMPAAIAAMKAGNFEEALKRLNLVTNLHGDRLKLLFGGRAGYIYYEKGRIELKLGTQARTRGELKLADDFFNKAKVSLNKVPEFPSDAKGENENIVKYLIPLGQVEQALKNYQAAINAYQKFLDDKRKQDKYNIGLFNINMAICHFKIEPPLLKEGIVFFEIALQNKEKYAVPDKAIVSAFKDFSSACIKKKEEKILVNFVDKNRSAITLDPYEMYQFIPFFRKDGAAAYEKGMIDAAFTLYSLMPGTGESEDDLAFRKSNFVGYKHPFTSDRFVSPSNKAHVEQIRLDNDRIKSAGDPHELLALQQLAFTHEQAGYTRGAYSSYEMLELYFNKSTSRELNLFNLVRTSSVVGLVFKTEKYGARFLKDFPNSEYAGRVRQLMLISLFFSGEYETAFKVSDAFLPTLKENTLQHDICLFVRGGSQHYLGNFFDAHPDLVKHVKLYPNSNHKLAAQYFEASNLSRMQNWALAATKLDKFIADYPDINSNIYLPFALYDRASTHFAEEEYDDAISKLNRIEKEFPGVAVQDISMNLRGDVNRAKGDKESSKADYLQGLKISEQRDNDLVTGESLYKLVALLGQEKEGREPNPHVQDAIPYFDRFWKEFQGSPYKAQTAVSGVPALMAAGRGEEALVNVQSVIAEMAKQKEAPGMEGAINTYSKFYLLTKTPEELQKHFRNFPGIDAGDKKAQALLQIAVISVYEDLQTVALKEKNEAKANEHAATIKVLFKDLNASFNKDDLSDFILIRLADFISRTKSPREALPFYDKIIERQKIQFRTRAQFGRAGILAKSNDPGEQGSALTVLKEVKNDPNSDTETKASAIHQMVELYAKQGNWSEVTKEANAYLEAGYRSEKKRISYNLAIGLDNSGDKTGAMQAYNGIFNRYKSEWTISLPSLIRAAELTREVGKADAKGNQPKQIAYNMAARFVKNSAAAYKKNKVNMSDQELADYDKVKRLVASWETEADIKTLEQVDKERGIN